MTKTDIGIYRGLKEKFDPEVHVGFYITTDTEELLIGDKSLGQTISGGSFNDGVLTLNLNSGKDIEITIPEATKDASGLLSAWDKVMLDKASALPSIDELDNTIKGIQSDIHTNQSNIDAHKQNQTNPHQVTKAQVGLSNVTNDAQVKRSEMGVANGVATLDADGKVPASQLPSYVDDIIDVYATYTKSDTGTLSNVTLYKDAAHTQLVTGEAGKIYQNIADGEPQYQFRWTGTIFSQTGASSLILGEVTGTAYDGAKGKVNADNIAKIKRTQLSHIKDAAPITTAADKVSLNYECFEGSQYGSTGTTHTADIPAATTTTAGVMSAADKTKLDSFDYSLQEMDGHIQFIDNALSQHVDSQQHIPEGGSKNQVLTWESEGKAQWSNISNVFTGLEDLLAYGVQWIADQSDPHLTRIGNMSLHKTLPIQSQLKGCIAQANKVMYWLDENDWRLRKDSLLLGGIKNLIQSPTDSTKGFNTIDIEATALKDKPCNIGQYIHITTVNPATEYFGTITNIESDINIHDEDTGEDIAGKRLTIEWEGEKPTSGRFSKVELGSNLSGYDGTVRVYCPNFYIKSEVKGDIRKVLISSVKIDDTWEYQPELLVDAYHCTLIRDIVNDGGYLSGTSKQGAAVSIMNTHTYCRGGQNLSDYDKYLTGDGVDIDVFRTHLGKPVSRGNIYDMEMAAEQVGSYLLGYKEYKNIFYWLYVIEYANFNCQEEFLSDLTADGYHQGGLDLGVQMDTITLAQYNKHVSITPCGYGNKLGNKTGVVRLTTPEFVTNPSSTTIYKSYTFNMPRWRGFDNPFGDEGTCLAGTVLNLAADAYNAYFRICRNFLFYHESPTSKYYEFIKTFSSGSSGYISSFDLGTQADIYPSSLTQSGAGQTYKCDFWEIPSSDRYDDYQYQLVVGQNNYYNDGEIPHLGLVCGNFSKSLNPRSFRTFSPSVILPS